ncbi:hypothetical protein SARC_10323 [Sphaeroforma arctica JP610]|uniref:Condensin complex subunit 1 C-terminal domain-containing protein n=1 Tax=Sphaeroforma arctica JP610 TaxID=667725 RepID=A0A0L0FKD1_9EUKA|nr:hypothetical protein SARC_10323 [Sphaeroforma arctica JP610]KNC77215.1 hypothetical protein SARC_10323 [Sphaeroforma arctica JP610]|eukprot:XP_014151117.1 hypothetical protein SARC_10323 [Sphaeroforma arctica JP610]
MLPVILQLANDAVPNVRFNVARTLKVCVENIQDKTVVQSNIVPVLNTLEADADMDVKYYAHQALIAGMLYNQLLLPLHCTTSACTGTFGKEEYARDGGELNSSRQYRNHKLHVQRQ